MAQSNGLCEILIENLRIRALEEGEVGIDCVKNVSDHREKDMVAFNYLETIKIHKYQQNSIKVPSRYHRNVIKMSSRCS